MVLVADVAVAVVDGGVGYASSIGSCLTVIIFSIKDKVPCLKN